MKPVNKFIPPKLYFDSDGTDFEEKQELYVANVLIPFLNARYGLNIPQENASRVSFEYFSHLDPNVEEPLLFLGNEILQNYALEVSNSLNEEDLLIFRKEISDEGTEMLVELDRVSDKSHVIHVMHTHHIYNRPPIESLKDFFFSRLINVCNKSTLYTKSLTFGFFAKSDRNPQLIMDGISNGVAEFPTLVLNQNDSEMLLDDEQKLAKFASDCTLSMLKDIGIFVLGVKIEYYDTRGMAYYDYKELDALDFLVKAPLGFPKDLEESEYLNFSK